MIHDAFVEVTCDGKGCSGSEQVELAFVYRHYTGRSGHYEHADSKIEDKLVKDFEWVVIDGKHYCCDDCAKQLV